MAIELTDSSFTDLARKVKILAIDFDGVMTDNSVYVTETGTEMVRCSRLEGFGLRRVERAGVFCLVLSTETNPVVAMRAKKLNIKCYQGVEDKVAVFQQILAEHQLAFEQAAFIGNDINDLKLLERVGLPVIVNDAHNSVMKASMYKTSKNGGYGAVRELCDAIGLAIETIND